MSLTDNKYSAGFSKYFSDLRKFDTKKELFKLKQVLARHKVYKAKISLMFVYYLHILICIYIVE